MWRSRAKIVWSKYMRIHTFMSFPSARIVLWCYIIFYFVFWHISTLKTCITWHSTNVLNFPFPALSSWEGLWMLEENEEGKKYIRRSRSSDKEGKNKQEERHTGCWMLKGKWVECSKEVQRNMDTWGLLEAFGFIKLVLSKQMKMMLQVQFLILQVIYLGFDRLSVK